MVAPFACDSPSSGGRAGNPFADDEADRPSTSGEASRVAWEAEWEDTSRRLRRLLTTLDVRDETPNASRAAHGTRSARQARRRAPAAMSKPPPSAKASRLIKLAYAHRSPPTKRTGAMRRDAGMRTPPAPSPARAPKPSALPSPSTAAAAMRSLEARVAGQKAANAALQSALKDKQAELGAMAEQNDRLHADLKSLRSHANLHTQATAAKAREQAEADNEARLDGLRKELEAKLRAAEDRHRKQSRRNQLLLERIKVLTADRAALSREKIEAEANAQRVAEGSAKTKTELKLYVQRCRDQADACTSHKAALSAYEARLEEAAQEARDAKRKVALLQREAGVMKTRLDAETGARDAAQGRLSDVEERLKRKGVECERAKAKAAKFDAQREKLLSTITQLKRINRELMGAVLSERAAHEGPLDVDEAEPPSLIPHMLRVAKEEGGGKGEVAGAWGGDGAAEAVDETEFYRNLKVKYQEAKEKYHSLL